MSTEETVSPVVETQNPAPEVAQETPEVAEPEQVEAEASVDTSEDDPDKTLKRMQRRIDKRTADVYRERARAEQLAQRVAELETRAGTTDERANEPADPRVLAREIARQERLNEKVESVIEKGRGKFKNFDTLTSNVADELGPSNWDGFRNVLIEVAESPENVVAYLGNNLDIASDLIGLSPFKLVKRLDRIDRELTDKSTPKPSIAPKPLDTVKASAISAGLSDNLTDSDWEKRRNADLRAKRQ